jgi:hypothetical protein
VRLLCEVSGSHLFLAWCCGAGDGGTSLRCYQVCRDGAASRHSVVDGVRVGVGAGADVGEGDDTCSCHLSVPCCTLHNLDLARVSICLERVGGKWDQLKRRDVRGIDVMKHLGGLWKNQT